MGCGCEGFGAAGFGVAGFVDAVLGGLLGAGWAAGGGSVSMGAGGGLDSTCAVSGVVAAFSAAVSVDSFLPQAASRARVPTTVISDSWRRIGVLPKFFAGEYYVLAS
jgi:hypothetical protein